MSEDNLKIDSNLEKYTNILKKNLKYIVTVFVLLFIAFVFLIFLENQKEKKQILFSEIFINAKLLLEQNKTNNAKLILVDLVDKKNKFYSTLSLSLIISNELEKDNIKIIKMFDKVLSIKSLQNEELNLIRYKKTIFLAKNNKTQELLESANIIINSNSEWRNEVINLLGEYFSGTANAATYDIVFSKPGYLNDTLSAILNNGIITVLDVALQPLVSFNAGGMVVDFSGNGISSVEVVIFNNDFTFNTTTDLNGNYTISNMYEGNYEIIAGQWGYVTSCGNEYITPSTISTITLEQGYYDDFTFDFNWTVNGNASAGMWERGLSEATNSQGQDFNPDGDVNNDCMDFAYVTGLSAGGQTGSNDVDDANTILTSPIFDLSSNQTHYLNYYSWFSNGGGGWGGGSAAADSLTVIISNGSTTVILETMTANSPDMGQWNSRIFNLGQYITLTSTMQLVIETADWDALGGHWVEGGFDKFSVTNAPNNITDISNQEKGKLIKIIDVLGREVVKSKNSPLFYIYENGSVEKQLLIK